jgi:hypothetical protein
MDSVNVFSLTALGALFFYFVITKIRAYIVDWQFSQAHGCKEPPRVPQSERIVGYDLIKRGRQNFKTKTLYKAGVERFEEIGPTFTGWVFGNKFIQTKDPENVKAILTTNFKDFGLGKRKEMLGDLLGDGIFTTDGVQWEHSRVVINPIFQLFPR